MPEYELTEMKKMILLQGLEVMIKQTQAKPDDFMKGAALAEMFETKDVLQRCRLTYKD